MTRRTETVEHKERKRPWRSISADTRCRKRPPTGANNGRTHFPLFQFWSSVDLTGNQTRSKWRRLGIGDPVRIVVTGTKLKRRSEREVIDEIRRRSHYYDEVLFIKKDGSFMRATK